MFYKAWKSKILTFDCQSLSKSRTCVSLCSLWSRSGKNCISAVMSKASRNLKKTFDQSRIQRKVDCYLWKEKKPTCQDLAATPGPPCPRVEEPLGWGRHLAENPWREIVSFSRIDIWNLIHEMVDNIIGRDPWKFCKSAHFLCASKGLTLFGSRPQ